MCIRDRFNTSPPAYFPGSTYAGPNAWQTGGAQGLIDYAQQMSGNNQWANNAQQFSNAATQGAVTGIGGLSNIGSGGMLGRNPFIDQMFDRGAERITKHFNEAAIPGLDAKFAGTGMGASGEVGGWRRIEQVLRPVIDSLHERRLDVPWACLGLRVLTVIAGS